MLSNYGKKSIRIPVGFDVPKGKHYKSVFLTIKLIWVPLLMQKKKEMTEKFT